MAAFRRLTRLALVALALAALLPAGCLLAVAGVAGAGAAGYAYYNGLLYRDYHASLADTQSALRTSLEELQFPVIEQKGDTGTASIKTRTADGHTVRIYLDIVPSPVPIEGALTRISIRVGFSGDESLSARILDQVSRHLVTPGAAAAVPAPPPDVRPVPQPKSAPIDPPPATMLPPRPVNTQSTPTPGVRPVSFTETSPPPLATPVSVTPAGPAAAPGKQ